MIFNKKQVAISVVAFLLLVSFHKVDAFSLKGFFNSIFGGDRVENTQEAASVKAVIDVSKEVKTDDTPAVKEPTVDPVKTPDPKIEIKPIKEVDPTPLPPVKKPKPKVLPKQKPASPKTAEQILFMGGVSTSNGTTYYNDVWSSADMFNWNNISPNDPTSTVKWSPRAGLPTTYYDGKYWVSTNSAVPDLWSSPDGINWTQLPNPPGVFDIHLVSFNNKLLAFSKVFDLNQGTYSIHTFSTANGINWTDISNNSILGQMTQYEVVVFNNKLYIIGGLEDGPFGLPRADVWSSSDGITWNLATNNGPKTFGAKGVSYNSKIYYFGGFENNISGGNQKIWSSPDGINWTLAMASPSVLFGHFDDIIVSNGKLWLVRSENNFPQYSNSLWYSTDGTNWTQSCVVLPWTGRQLHRMVSNGGTPANTPDPCTQPTPNITVTSPNGGEAYQAGQQIPVTWTSQNIPSTDVVEVELTSDQSPTTLGYSTLNTGTYQFNLPALSQLSAYGWSIGTHYKIRVKHYPPNSPGGTLPDASDLSDNLFTIFGPNSNPTLTISLSPTTPLAQTVPAGTNNVHIADFDFTAVDALYFDRITTGIFDQAFGDNIYLNLKNVRLMLGNTQYGATETSLADYRANFYQSISFSQGEKKTFSLYADVLPGVINGTKFRSMVDMIYDTLGIVNVNNQTIPSTGWSNFVTIANPISSTCSINSFTVPSSTTLASNLNVTVSWSSNCSNVIVEANSGSYTQRWSGGSNGTHTFVAPSGAVLSTTDNSVEVTLIGGNDTDTTSQTKSVPVSNLPGVVFNQCHFSYLNAVPNPVPSGSSQTTLKWKAQAGCIVYVESWTPSATGLTTEHIFKPGTLYFNAIDSVTVNLSKSTTYYVTAKAGADTRSVLSATTVDVKKN